MSNTMKYRAFEINKNGDLDILDQTALPFEERVITLTTAEETTAAIKEMKIRGAGTIGSIAAFGIYLAVRHSNSWKMIEESASMIRASRPTAVNLMWAVDRMMHHLKVKANDVCDRNKNFTADQKEILTKIALDEATCISDEDVIRTKKIGEYGYKLIQDIRTKTGKETIQILTHCNAGWLGIVDRGTALAPVYESFDRGEQIHVWVDETRPRNQGANLTSWELGKAGVPCTVIADNTGGHLMQQGLVDICFVGADRVTRSGDTANKIGTYLKALSAHEHSIPFYVALPVSTFDFSILNGADIPIENRDAEELTLIRGINQQGKLETVRIMNESVRVFNPSFDVTPAKFISGLVTERGVIAANRNSIEKEFADLL